MSMGDDRKAAKQMKDNNTALAIIFDSLSKVSDGGTPVEAILGDLRALFTTIGQIDPIGTLDKRLSAIMETLPDPPTPTPTESDAGFMQITGDVSSDDDDDEADLLQRLEATQGERKRGERKVVTIRDSKRPITSARPDLSERTAPNVLERFETWIRDGIAMKTRSAVNVASSDMIVWGSRLGEDDDDKKEALPADISAMLLAIASHDLYSLLFTSGSSAPGKRNGIYTPLISILSTRTEPGAESGVVTDIGRFDLAASGSDIMMAFESGVILGDAASGGMVRILESLLRIGIGNLEYYKIASYTLHVNHAITEAARAYAEILRFITAEKKRGGSRESIAKLHGVASYYVAAVHFWLSYSRCGIKAFDSLQLLYRSHLNEFVSNILAWGEEGNGLLKKALRLWLLGWSWPSDEDIERDDDDAGLNAMKDIAIRPFMALLGMMVLHDGEFKDKCGIDYPMDPIAIRVAVDGLLSRTGNGTVRLSDENGPYMPARAFLYMTRMRSIAIVDTFKFRCLFS